MSPTLNNPFERPIAEIGQLGIELSQPGGPDSRHLAIVFSVDGEEPRRCHLLWHHVLRGELSNGWVQWLKSGLGEITQRTIALFCKKLLQEALTRKSAISFGFSPILRSFDPSTAVYRPPAPGQGSTCATFVMEVFFSMGVALLKDEQWKPRKADKAWQDQIVGELVRRNADPTHVIELSSQCKGIRFRPEEVAAAVAASNVPLTFRQAETQGEALIEELRRFSRFRS